MNDLVGHLLEYRCSVLRACGGEHPNVYEETFSPRTPATDGGEYPDLSEMLRVQLGYRHTHELALESR